MLVWNKQKLKNGLKKLTIHKSSGYSEGYSISNNCKEMKGGGLRIGFNPLFAGFD